MKCPSSSDAAGGLPARDPPSFSEKKGGDKNNGVCCVDFCESFPMSLDLLRAASIQDVPSQI